MGSPSGAKIRPKKQPRPATQTISFRLDQHHLRGLEKGATAYGLSVHEYARQRLVELLDRQEEWHLLAQLRQTRSGVDALREDLARVLEIILVNTTSSDPGAVRRWIEVNLRRP